MKTTTCFSFASFALALLLAPAHTRAQCTEVTGGLRLPLGIAITNQGNVIVSETGTGAPGSGRGIDSRYRGPSPHIARWSAVRLQ